MKNKIVFITKSLCYHQVYLSDKLYEIYGDSFCFIQTREPLDFRVAVHQEGFERPYLLGLARSAEEYDLCINILKKASVVIVGELSSKFSKIINKKALVLKYSERIFKKELDRYSFLKRIKQKLFFLNEKFFTFGNRAYLLSAGAYSPLDYSKFGLYKNKAFKWGYFPKYFKYDWSELSKEKSNNKCLQIVWASRLIKYKHPQTAINVALFLKQKGIRFKMHIIGDGDEKSGELKKEIESQIIAHNMQDEIIMHGKIPAEEVLEFYRKCDIALFTYSFSEGWGVGVNEAMNAGCVVVSAHSVGSARYLIKNGINGLIYEYGNNEMLFDAVLRAATDSELRFNIGKKAYQSIVEIWNYENAAKRLSILIDCLQNGKQIPFEDGPCSKADIINEKWMK